MPLFFDIETGGLSGVESSIYSLSYQKGKQARQDIFADPTIGSRMYRWSEQNVWAEVKQRTNRVAEKDLLSRWIKVLKANVGEELIGWNIGFDVEAQVPFQEKGRAFDIPMTLTRAAEYGLEGELAEAYRGMKIRDIGREYAVAISREVTANMSALEGKVDPAILEQAFKFNEAAERAAESLGEGATTRDIAAELSRRRFSMAGWKQEQIAELLGHEKFRAHTAEDVTALTRFAPADQLKLSVPQLEKWGRGALESTLIGQAMTHRFETPAKVSWEHVGEGRFERVMSAFDKPTDYWEHLTSRARAGGITDFEETVAARVKAAGGSMDEVRRGLGVLQSFETVGEVSKQKFAARLAAFDASSVPLRKIGLGIGAILGGMYLGNMLIPGFDDEYNTIEGLGHEGIAGRLRKINTDFGSGWGGLPATMHGQRIDPRILSFRGSIWDNMEARAEFEAELQLRQENHNRAVGSFKAAEMFNVNASVFKAISRRNDDMKLIRLAQYDVNVEDADTLVLKRKGLLNWFDDPVQVRLAGIDAPEVAGHEDDPLDFIRMWQAQPGGEEAADVLRSIMEENESATLLVDAKRKTYGRYLGAVIGDQGQNINLELIRRGAVTALPFGPTEFDVLQRGAAREAEDMARRDRRGIWQLKRYQATALANSAIGRPLTHNMLTRIDKMGANLNVGAYSSFLAGLGSETGELTAQEMAQARRHGRSLRKSHGPYKIPKKTDANTIEGLGHKGIAWRIRQSMT
ncbi:MAG: thermonuclease family protein, partial [Candidatus Thorarchaeota archaeon]